MQPERPQTIFSLSSGRGRAGVAVIRVSGPQAEAALVAVAGRLPPVRVATVMTLRDGSGVPIDQALVLRFAAGRSFTGEPTVELQLHGGRAVVRAALNALAAVPGLRLAEPGEFTRRALENGRLDLAQAEALADLIDADTERQRRQALHGAGGALGGEVARWRALLVEAKALVAAAIDFSDEDGVDEAATEALRPVLARLRGELERALASSRRGRIVAEGFRVAIVGPPNAGKSTLLNALAGSDIAIVTDQAGTTRDILEVRIDLDGYEIVLQDTAGLRDALDPAERIGVERARMAAAEADLVLMLDHGADARWDFPDARRSIRVRTKTDLDRRAFQGHDLAISVHGGQGLDSLLERLRQEVERLAPDSGEPATVINLRQDAAVSTALRHLAQADSLAACDIDFVAEHLNDADRALAELIGAVGIEETLGAVFSRFCVGK
jgi:tRNA modification GTPase